MKDKPGLESVPGFDYAGLALSGEKKNVGLILSKTPHTLGAAVFTRNDVKAAPVRLSQRLDRETAEKRVVLVNSGNANAYTGRQGEVNAETMVREIAQLTGVSESQCYLASTGVIGQQLAMEQLLAGLPALLSQAGPAKGLDFIEAIMTTDTRPKQAARSVTLSGQEVHLAGCLKGAGMIMPNLATMLCFLVTDARISPEMLKKALVLAVEDTLNSLTVDSDTSTNDSVFILANGLANNAEITNDNKDFKEFRQSLTELLHELAQALIADAEGATKHITIEVQGAKSREIAQAIAFSVANSPLVKTAFFGEQLNWGRLVMAVGKVQAGIDPEKLDLDVNGYPIVVQGEPQLGTDAYQKAEGTLTQTKQHVRIDLHQGTFHKTVYTCDFSLDYIKINANYIS